MRLLLGDFVLDLGARQLLRGREEIHTRPKTFELLKLLVDTRPRALSKVEIRRHLWPETAVEDVTLTVLVADLRAILGDHPRQSRYVRTVHRFGYAFCGDVSEDTPVRVRLAETPPSPSC